MVRVGGRSMTLRPCASCPQGCVQFSRYRNAWLLVPTLVRGSVFCVPVPILGLCPVFIIVLRLSLLISRPRTVSLLYSRPSSVSLLNSRPSLVSLLYSRPRTVSLLISRPSTVSLLYSRSSTVSFFVYTRPKVVSCDINHRPMVLTSVLGLCLVLTPILELSFAVYSRPRIVGRCCLLLYLDCFLCCLLPSWDYVS